MANPEISFSEKWKSVKDANDFAKSISMIPEGPLANKWSKRKFEYKLVNPANRRKFHVIVVGSGLAGGACAACRRVCRLPGAEGRLFGIKVTFL